MNVIACSALCLCVYLLLCTHALNAYVISPYSSSSSFFSSSFSSFSFTCSSSSPLPLPLPPPPVAGCYTFTRRGYSLCKCQLCVISPRATPCTSVSFLFGNRQTPEPILRVVRCVCVLFNEWKGLWTGR